MERNQSRAEALLESVDALISKHGGANPELVAELQVLRDHLQDAFKRKNHQEMALVAFRIASWVRYVVELFGHF